MGDTRRASDGALLDSYSKALSINASRQLSLRAARFLRWLDGRPLDKKAVEGWMAKRRERDRCADGTIAWEFQVLRRLYLANKIEWPFRRGDAPVIRESEVYKPALSTPVVGEIVAAARERQKRQPHYACFTALSTIYGLRRQEIAAMTPASLRNGLIFVETVKHGRQRSHLVPDFVLPWIERWGFRVQFSGAMLGEYFNNLKRDIGMSKQAGMEINWHSIRRALVIELKKARLPDYQIESFLRWKPMGGMHARYAASEIVDKEGRRAGQNLSDEEADRAIFAVHPFLQLWKE